MSSQQSRKGPASDGGGPTAPAPRVPEGWLAQWESKSKQWYYVQHATGHTQWELPTEPFIPTPSSTPASSIASPGPYHPPIPGADDDATQELRNVRTGANWRTSGSDFPVRHQRFQTNPKDGSQTQPGQMHQQTHSSSLQTTPVPGGSGHASRASNDGMFSAVASDLASRTASSEMSGVQQTTPQNSHGYPTPSSQGTAPGTDSMNMSPQYTPDTQQRMPTQMAGYPPQADAMDLENRLPAQDPNAAYRGADSGTYQQQGYHTTPSERTGQPGSYYPSGAPYQTHPDSMAGVQQTPAHAGSEAPPAAGHQLYGNYGGRPPEQMVYNEQYSAQPARPPHTQQRPAAVTSESFVVIQSDPSRPLFPTPYRQARPGQPAPPQSAPQPQYDNRQYPPDRYGGPPQQTGRPAAPYYDSAPQGGQYGDSYQRGGMAPQPTRRYETGQDPRYEHYPAQQPRTMQGAPGQYAQSRAPGHPEDAWRYEQPPPGPVQHQHPGYAPGPPATHPPHYQGQGRGYPPAGRR